MLSIVTIGTCWALASIVRTVVDALHVPAPDSARRSPSGRASLVQRPTAPTSAGRDLALVTAALPMALGAASLPWLGAAAVVPASYVMQPALGRALEGARRRRVVAEQADALGFVTGLAVGSPLAAVAVAMAASGRHVLVSWRGRAVARDLEALFGQSRDRAWCRRDGVDVSVAVADLTPGDVVGVQSGDTIPVDGTVTEGRADVALGLVAGTDDRVVLIPGSQGLAGSRVLAGRLQIRAERTGEHTRASSIARAVARAADMPTAVERRSLQTGATLTAYGLALGAAVMPALGLARGGALAMTGAAGPAGVVPRLALHRRLGVAVRRDVVIKDSGVFDRLPAVDTMVFDRAGTLTTGTRQVVAVRGSRLFARERVLRLAAAAEQRFTHPVALAIAAHARARGVSVPACTVAESRPGLGVTARIDGKAVLVGNERLLQQDGVALPPGLQRFLRAGAAMGHSTAVVAVDGAAVGAIELAPELRPEARQVIDALRRRGLQTIVLSGDDDTSTRALATMLGMDGYFAETLPERRVAVIRRLQSQGRSVCFVGDGVNDAPTVREAMVGVSLQGPATIPLDSADVVFAREDLRLLVWCRDLTIRFERDTDRAATLGRLLPLAAAPAVLLLPGGLVTAAAAGVAGLVAAMAWAERDADPAALPTGSGLVGTAAQTVFDDDTDHATSQEDGVGGDSIRRQVHLPGPVQTTASVRMDDRA